MYDLRTPSSASNHLTLSIPMHAPTYAPAEALTHDWNKYHEHVIATAGVDKLIRVFDVRAAGKGPLSVLSGHDYAVRKIAWSPHLPDMLLSASYDMTARVWTIDPGDDDGGWKESGGMTAHTEFVTGLDWCLFGDEGWCATCAWDERVLVWDIRSVMTP